MMFHRPSSQDARALVATPEHNSCRPATAVQDLLTRYEMAGMVVHEEWWPRFTPLLLPLKTLYQLRAPNSYSDMDS